MNIVPTRMALAFDWPFDSDLKNTQQHVFWGGHHDGLVPWEQKFVNGSNTYQGLRDLGIN